MGVHVYCIVRPHVEPQASIRGVDGAAVHAVTAGDIAIWLSTHERAPGASVNAAREHNDVVHAAMDRANTPVPLRFGQWFEDEAAAEAAVSSDTGRWRRLLDHFAGRVEYGVGLWSAGPAREMHAERPQSGTAYMAELARRAGQAGRMRQEAERLADLIREQAGALLVDSRVVDTSGEGASIAHLLAWEDVTAYHTVIRAVSDGESSLRLLPTGPWPPYSFVE